MKIIKSSFKKFGDQFTMVKRVGDVALYERTKEGYVYSGWEVIIIQKAKASNFNVGASVINWNEGDEFYPNSESFGKKGWYYSSRELADVKFESLIK